MSEVFLSYAREDVEIAERLATALNADGLDVWWDATLIAGQRFDQVIANVLDSAAAVIVLWSKHSIESHWVRDEAGVARDRGVLTPVAIADVRPPLGFGGFHTPQLVDWSGERSSDDYQSLLNAVRTRIEQGPDVGLDGQPDDIEIVLFDQAKAAAAAGDWDAVGSIITSLEERGPLDPAVTSLAEEAQAMQIDLRKASQTPSPIVDDAEADEPHGSEDPMTEPDTPAEASTDQTALATTEPLEDAPDAGSPPPIVDEQPAGPEDTVVMPIPMPLGVPDRRQITSPIPPLGELGPLRKFFMWVGVAAVTVLAIAFISDLGTGSTTTTASVGGTEETTGETVQVNSFAWSQPNRLAGTPEFDPDAATVDRRATAMVQHGGETLLFGWGSFGGDVNGAMWRLADGAIQPIPSQMNAFAPDDPSEQIWGAASDGSRIVAVGQRGSEEAVAFYSDDGGDTWTEGSVGSDGSMRSVLAHDGGFVAVGFTLPPDVADRRIAVWRSPDGASWSPVTTPDLGQRIAELDDIASSGSVMVASGRAGNDDEDQMRAIAIYSQDGGGSWEMAEVEHERDDTRMHGLVWTGEVFVGVGWSDPARPVTWTSEDGARWTITWSGATEDTGENAVIRRVVQVGDTLVGVGYWRVEDDRRPAAWASTSGGDWQRLEWQSDLGVPTSIAVVGDSLVITGYGPTDTVRALPLAWQMTP